MHASSAAKHAPRAAQPPANPVAKSKRRVTQPSPCPPPRKSAPRTLASIMADASDEEEEDGDGDSDNDTRTEHHRLAAPIWSPRVLDVHRCRHCFQDECVGCACLCEESDEWLEHPGGHYFPTCACGGQDCPGCACICPVGVVWKEHGGHSRKKKTI